MVAVCFLWFYYHGKGIINANTTINPPLPLYSALGRKTKETPKSSDPIDREKILGPRIFHRIWVWVWVRVQGMKNEVALM